MIPLNTRGILHPHGEMQQTFATAFATSFAKATEVKESFGGQRKLRFTKRDKMYRLLYFI
jgi:hypothetical protein